jgi:phage protein D/phage baseplate assembly protein gpV
VTTLVTLPVVDVSIDGDDPAAPFAASIRTLEVSQSAYEPAACEITVRDAAGTLAARLTLGASLRVRLGAAQDTVFAGTVAAIEYRLDASNEREVRVLAYDALETLRRRMSVHTYVGVSFADLATELARDCGLTVGPIPPTPAYRRIVQHRRSDLALLADIAERSGLAFGVEDGALAVYALPGTGAPTVLTYGVELREVSVVASATESVGGVDVSGWDAQRVEPRSGKAAGGSGSRALPITNVVVDSDAHADGIARSQVARRAIAAMRVDAIADGDPHLRPGARVRFAGVPDAAAGPHTITHAVHRFDPRGGFSTTFGTALPPPHAPDQVVTGTLGVVADVRDPEKLGRIKVRYPALADAESDWLQIVAAGAGGGKGVVALPAVDDNVLVLMLDGDPAHGIVIGALYGAGGMPQRGSQPVTGYALFSPGGHIIELIDGGALTLHAANGSSLELGPDGARLHSETDLLLDVPGKNVTIRAQHVDIQRA